MKMVEEEAPETLRDGVVSSREERVSKRALFGDHHLRTGIKILFRLSPLNMLHTCLCHDWTLR